MHKRIFLCQSSIQLISSLAAAKTCSIARTDQCEDYLLFSNWNIDNTLADSFFATTVEIADRLHHWQGKFHIRQSDCPTTSVLREKSWDPMAQYLVDSTGINGADELYLPKEYGLLNALVLDAYNSAHTVCYGDGIGLNFSETYFAAGPVATQPEPGATAGAVPGSTRISLQRLLPPQPEITIDTYCLLLPNLFDQQVENPVIPDANLYKAYFSTLSAHPEKSLGELAAEILPICNNDIDLNIVLTSNLSEFGKMDRTAEVTAYTEFMRPFLNPNSVVLIKPHPLDSSEKIQQLQAQLQSICPQVLCAGQPIHWLHPLEALLPAILEKSAPKRPKMFCFSTSCLSLELLFDLHCETGFGENIVRRYFDGSNIESRLKHEADLHHAVEQIRTRTKRSIPGKTEDSRTR